MALALMTVVISGFAIFANKIFIVDMDPTIFTAVRAMIIGLAFFLIASWQSRFDYKQFKKVPWKWLLAIGIIGGGLAGTTAAETIRQHDSESPCAIISDEPYHLYSRVMLSKPPFFLGKVPFERIWHKKEEWYEQNNITYLGGRQASHIDAKNKIVTLDDGSHIRFDKLLLAIGADARCWETPGCRRRSTRRSAPRRGTRPRRSPCRRPRRRRTPRR